MRARGVDERLELSIDVHVKRNQRGLRNGGTVINSGNRMEDAFFKRPPEKKDVCGDMWWEE